MKSNHIKFFLLMVILLLFQAWLMTLKDEQFTFSDFPTIGADGVVFNNSEELKNTRSKKIIWTYNRWIPDSLEKKFFQLSTIRNGSIRSGGNTLIDAHIEFTSVTEFLMYFPRAFQVGLLSPFPQFWGGEGSTPAMTLARKIVGAVTLVFYFCIIGLLSAIVIDRKNGLLWTMLIFCFVGIVLYSYVSANTGTIVRTRYGFYMLLVSFGFAHIVQLIQLWFKNRGNSKHVS